MHTQQEKQRKDSFKEAWSVQWHRPSFQAFFFCFNTAHRTNIFKVHSIVFVISWILYFSFFTRGIFRKPFLKRETPKNIFTIFTRQKFGAPIFFKIIWRAKIFFYSDDWKFCHRKNLELLRILSHVSVQLSRLNRLDWVVFPGLAEEQGLSFQALWGPTHTCKNLKLPSK